MRARQSPERGRKAFGAAARSGPQRIPTSGSMCRSAMAGCSRKKPSTGCTRPSPSRAWTGVRYSSRAAKCWADRVRSTGCCMFAASTRITIAGASTAIWAGAMTTCCRISRRPRTRYAAPTISMASAARSRFPNSVTPIRCRRRSSRRQPRPASPKIPISTARPRKAPAFSRPRRVTAEGRARRCRISVPPRAARTCTSRPRHWRSALCSTGVAPSPSSTARKAPCARRGRARKSWFPAARTIRRNCCSSPASDPRSCCASTASMSCSMPPASATICRITCRSGW